MVDLRLEQHEDETGQIVIRVLDVVPNVGFRVNGAMLRNYVMNYLEEGIERVIIDFQGSEMISSSFADEVMGALVQEYGRDILGSRIGLRGVGDDVATVIRRAIAKRLF